MITAKKQEQKISTQNKTITTLTISAKLFNVLINFKNMCASKISACD